MEMDLKMAENGTWKWRFRLDDVQRPACAVTVRGVVNTVMESLNQDDGRVVVQLGRGDPSASLSFRTVAVAEGAVMDMVHSAKYNCYAPAYGLLPTRRAVAEYLSRDLPYELSSEDVFITIGCAQAVDVMLTVLARPGANILLPRPGFPFYEARAAHSHLEVRHFDLLPNEDWEIDLKGVMDAADENTVAMVIINPGNPCGNIFSHQHLKEVAETARKLGIMVISDEVYGHLAFGSTPFIPMGMFGSIVPVLTLGSISKRWVVPGWRLGWLAVNDPSDSLKDSGILDAIKGYMDIAPNPATFIQAAVPRILERTTDEFFSRINGLLRESAEICFEKLKDIHCVYCPKKPEGSMFVMVKLNLPLLDGIKDDLDFCTKLAKEESVVILPGVALGLKNWLRITFAIETCYLDDGLERMKVFCKRHAK
ncbi:hypothetical protein MLD38_030549 [Melastoma candidum]|uniref:Uncharacterized protein n=1 Tax=Melastoma candidum TaxID=119954 RepID=A0ACB9MQK5_9MYRT|nr:hypothetical protein MLD38_030549 [Melastoma candidum]